MIFEWYRKHKSLLEFSLRIYVAYYLVDYGISKLTGGMFNNATPEILKTELQKVDLFHLTWFFFYKSKLLSYTVGVCQILSAILLLFDKTVLWGCMIALPILINIFLIDVSVFPDHVLAARVLLYIACIALFIIYRRKAVTAALAALGANMPPFKVGKLYYLLYIPLALAFYLLVEILTCSIIGRYF